jgi:hypothetical protein
MRDHLQSKVSQYALAGSRSLVASNSDPPSAALAALPGFETLTRMEKHSFRRFQQDLSDFPSKQCGFQLKQCQFQPKQNEFEVKQRRLRVKQCELQFKQNGFEIEQCRFQPKQHEFQFKQNEFEFKQCRLQLKQCQVEVKQRGPQLKRRGFGVEQYGLTAKTQRRREENEHLPLQAGSRLSGEKYLRMERFQNKITNKKIRGNHDLYLCKQGDHVFSRDHRIGQIQRGHFGDTCFC